MSLRSTIHGNRSAHHCQGRLANNTHHDGSHHEAGRQQARKPRQAVPTMSPGERAHADQTTSNHRAARGKGGGTTNTASDKTKLQKIRRSGSLTPQ